MVPGSYMRRVHVLLLASLSACPRPSVPRSSQAPAVRPGVDPCAADLSGTWVHGADPSWEYDAVDDGGTVELSVWRRFDGGSSDAGAAASVQLRRGDGGFTGEAHALGGLPSGQTFPMTFPARVTQCSPGA